MPPTLHATSPVAGPGRRGFLGALVAGGVGLLAGCSLGGPSPTPTPEVPEPGVDALRTALAEEQALLAAYAAAAGRHPALVPLLAAAESDHTDHRRVLQAVLDQLGAHSPAASPQSLASVPDDPARALAALADLERDVASARMELAVAAPARWAPLLGVLAAGEAAHAAVLTS